MPYTPTVSIITPTKNRVELLVEASNSVVKQTYSKWEHLIIDDGSSDETSSVFMQRSANDQRIRYIARSTVRGGANVCRNIGIELARGNYIIFLDSDDLLSADCLEKRVDAISQNHLCDFITFQSSLFINNPGDLGRTQDDYGVSNDDLTRFLYFEIPWIITAPIWRREALLRIGGFDESLPSWQDVDLHIRALTAGYKYLRIETNDHHIRRRYDPGKLSMMQRETPEHLFAAEHVLIKFEQYVRDGMRLDWVRMRALCSLYFFVAECWIKINKPSHCVRTLFLVYKRGLGPYGLCIAGSILLILQLSILPGSSFAIRFYHKWKGWARLRTNPELV